MSKNNHPVGVSPSSAKDEVLVKAAHAEANKNPKAESKTSTVIQKIKDKVFTLDTLVRFGLYTFRTRTYQSGANPTIAPISAFFKENEIPLFDFGCMITGTRNFSKMSDFRVAKAGGCYFFLFVKPEEILTKASVTVYTPIWQRDRAKKILKKHFSESRPRGMFLNNGPSNNRRSFIDSGIATQEQFVRKNLYDYVDNIFRRMVEDKQWYVDNGKAFKETFLLHGEPGTGKTNLYVHFSARYNLNVARFNPKTFVEEFDWIMDTAADDDRQPLVVLIEDLDACPELLRHEFRKNVIESKDSDFNYSSFINALEGAEKLHNIIVGLSTNFAERLIPSITRPGRVDHKLELTPLNSVEIGEFVRTDTSEYIGTFPDGTFNISNIIDLRSCNTNEEVLELAEWLDEESKH